MTYCPAKLPAVRGGRTRVSGRAGRGAAEERQSGPGSKAQGGARGARARTLQCGRGWRGTRIRRRTRRRARLRRATGSAPRPARRGRRGMPGPHGRVRVKHGLEQRAQVWANLVHQVRRRPRRQRPGICPAPSPALSQRRPPARGTARRLPAARRGAGLPDGPRRARRERQLLKGQRPRRT
jgi:hypothetical protein